MQGKVLRVKTTGKYTTFTRREIPVRYYIEKLIQGDAVSSGNFLSATTNEALQRYRDLTVERKKPA